MKDCLRRWLPALIVVATAACSAPAPAPAPTPPPAPPPPPAITQVSVEQAVEAAAAALRAGDAAKAASSYASNAVLVTSRGKVESSAGIEAFWAGALKATGGAGKDLKLAVEKWGTSGDMSYSLSRFTGGITAPSGYVLAVSMRQADGTLKTVAQISIPDAPAK